MRIFYFGFIFMLLFFDWFNLGDEFAYAKIPLQPQLSFTDDIYHHEEHELELPEIIKEKWPIQNQTTKNKNLKVLKYRTCEKVSGGLKCEEKILKKRNPKIEE